jgi:hypothetical protein
VDWRSVKRRVDAVEFRLGLASRPLGLALLLADDQGELILGTNGRRVSAATGEEFTAEADAAVRLAIRLPEIGREELVRLGRAEIVEYIDGAVQVPTATAPAAEVVGEEGAVIVPPPGELLADTPEAPAPAQEELPAPLRLPRRYRRRLSNNMR